MEHSGDIAIALEQLRMANVMYCEALNALKDYKENRAACLKDFQRFKNQPSDTEFRRKLFDEAKKAEETAKENLKRARTELRIKQRAYDKLKRLAVSEKKAQKDSAARDKKQWEKTEEKTKQKAEEEQKAKEKAEKEKAEAEKTGEEAKEERQWQEEASRKFWKDGYKEETPPKNPRKPQGDWKLPRLTGSQTLASPSAWKLACNKALSDRSTMTSFPDPPYSNCGLDSCALSRNERALKACQCNIAKAFQRDPNYLESLKSERLRWHPDKFSICPEEHRAVFQAKAKEIFVVANHLYERYGKPNNGK